MGLPSLVWAIALLTTVVGGSILVAVAFSVAHIGWAAAIVLVGFLFVALEGGAKMGAQRDQARNERDEEKQAHRETKEAREVHHTLKVSGPHGEIRRFDDGTWRAALSLHLDSSYGSALEYKVERFVIDFNGKTTPDPEFGLMGGVLRVGETGVYQHPVIAGLSRDDLQAGGTCGFSVVYGAPGGVRFRHARKMTLELRTDWGQDVPDNFNVRAIDQEDSDTPI